MIMMMLGRCCCCAAAGALAAVKRANDASTASPIVLIVPMLLVSLNVDSYSPARYGEHDSPCQAALNCALNWLALVLAFGAMHLSHWVSVAGHRPFSVV